MNHINAKKNLREDAHRQYSKERTDRIWTAVEAKILQNAQETQKTEVKSGGESCRTRITR